MNTSNYIQTVIVSLAVASICYTISKSLIFKSIRILINKYSKRLYNFISCPYCLSHWISLGFAICYLSSLLEIIIITFATVTLSSIWIGMIHRTFEFMTHEE